MIVSFDWLCDFVLLEASAEELAGRLTMAGLNLESLRPCEGDTALDLEVTSNRPDCLGHIGVAREAAVLFERPLTIPAAAPPAEGGPVDEAAALRIDCLDLCPAYIARVIEGITVGPSPDWLRRRLECINVTPVNNVVDVTNYVLMECGQPLHAFDLDQLHEQRIIVRRARAAETIVGIDHREYRLTPEMCVIADAGRAVAIGGVMGGAATEIHTGTRRVLIEVAQFQPLSIHRTARALRLRSPSSDRFERRVDEQQLDWASRRCCELILQTAGGTLRRGAVLAGGIPGWSPEPIRLRFPQVRRMLGIEIAPGRCLEILERLGVECPERPSPDEALCRPPSWRRDLTREIDLIEEVARIHGYEQIPEDRPIPVVAAVRSLPERVEQRVRNVLVAAGFCEAVTFSFTSGATRALFDPPVAGDELKIVPPAGDYGDRLRRSLIPSLLECRGENARRGSLDADLFEVARVYLRAEPARPDSQPRRIGLVCGRSFAELRGVLDAIARAARPNAVVSVAPLQLPQFLPGRGAAVALEGRAWGWMGEIDRDAAGVSDLKLRDLVAVAELDLQPLLDCAELVVQARPVPAFPAVHRDLNFVLEEQITWDQLDGVVRDAGAPWLEDVQFVEQYRGQQIPAGKKSYVLSLAFRALDRTLTGEEVDAVLGRIVTTCRDRLRATLR